MRKKQRIKINCKECDKEFYLLLVRTKRNRGKFCSRKCYGVWRSKNLKGKNSPSYRGKKKKRICLVCGKIFYKFYSWIKQGGGKFCSRKCKNIWLSWDENIGKNHPNWRGGKKERICKTCNKKFLSSPCNIKIGWGKFCSKSCNAIWRMKHSKTKNTSIELKVEQMLKELGINYESQKCIPEGRTIADFYIPEQRLVIYADGLYWHSKPERIIRDKKQNVLLKQNGFNILRLGENEIKNSPELVVDKINKKIKSWKQLS